MSVDVAPEIVIARPRAEVASYMFDPAKDLEWTGGIVACKPLTPGLLRTGSRVERTSKFLGRRFSYLVEVTDHEDGAFVQMRVTEPFPMEIRYELEDVDGDGDGDGSPRTRARIRARGEATGFFRIAGGLLSPMVKSSIRKDLERLKQRLERS